MVSERIWTGIRRRQAGRAPPGRGAGCAVRGAAPGAAPQWLEGYGPGGTAVLAACVSGDLPRTGAAVRPLFQQHGGHLGAPGSVAYLFRQAGVLSYPPGTDRERLAQLAYAADAEDVVASPGGGTEVLTAPWGLAAVQAHLGAHCGPPEDVRVLWRAHACVPLTGEDARRMLALLLELERRDELGSIYSNAEIPDEIVAQL